MTGVRNGASIESAKSDKLLSIRVNGSKPVPAVTGTSKAGSAPISVCHERLFQSGQSMALLRNPRMPRKPNKMRNAIWPAMIARAGMCGD